ncbi:hypothetical protein TRICI_000166 [Trichomonascus ciferrii]|uniref:Uncharacterized protein n=1 Tax=Trichomonascus ciferrii TaxID=44093 RepID=A0A642VE52_9ASCO|nr:hypothetical protein TRICI_000166 [Trichomonascus ciferrii]
MEENAVSGFQVNIEPYIRLGPQLDGFVARINESAVDFQVSLTFADAYDGDNLAHHQIATLSRHFTDVRFRLNDNFFPTNHFAFDENCNISKLAISNLSRNGSRLSAIPWKLAEIPNLFSAAVGFVLLKLEGLELETEGELSGWSKIQVDELSMHGCVYHVSGKGSLRRKPSKGPSSRKPQCMAKKITIQRQGLDFLYGFEFPCVSEFKIQSEYIQPNGFPITPTAVIQNLQLYSGPIEPTNFDPATFSGLAKLQSLELVYSYTYQDLSHFVLPLLRHCPNLMSIQFISTLQRVSRAFKYPDWSEVKEPYNYSLPSRITDYPPRRPYYGSDFEYDKDDWY